MRSAPSNLSLVTAAEPEKPSQEQPLSEKAERSLKEQTILHVMKDYYYYKINECNETPDSAQEICLDILSGMIEDGHCSHTCIEKFTQRVLQDGEGSTESIGEDDSFQLDALTNFSSVVQADQLHNDEQKKVDDFNDALTRLRDAASSLAELFYPSVVSFSRKLVQDYKGFDEAFASRF